MCASVINKNNINDIRPYIVNGALISWQIKEVKQIPFIINETPLQEWLLKNFG